MGFWLKKKFIQLKKVDIIFNWMQIELKIVDIIFN